MKLEYYIKKKKYHSLKTKKVETQYVAALKEKARATSEYLCKSIEVGSTMSRYEAALVLDEWSDLVIEELARGRSVQIGNIGTLRPRLEAKAQSDPKDVTFKTISKVKLVFYPSMELIREVNYSPLQKVKYIRKGVKEEKKSKDE